jgi:hypothetical protein
LFSLVTGARCTHESNRAKGGQPLRVDLSIKVVILGVRDRVFVGFLTGKPESRFDRTPDRMPTVP